MIKIGNSSLVRTAFALALLALTGQAQAVTEIQWWHSMTGALGDRVNDIAKRFNDEPEGLQGRAGVQGQLRRNR